MKKRLVTLFVAACFPFVTATVMAQFPKIKKPKPAEEKAASPSTTTSQAPKTITWTDNGISFEVPGDWQQMVLQRDVASFMLTTGDSAGLNATISRMGKDFPVAASLKANHDDAAKKKQSGEYVSYEDHPVGKVKGVMWLEAPKSSSDDVRRLTWIGFQKRNGWNQVTVHLTSKSGAFPNHEQALRKVLASLKVESE